MSGRMLARKAGFRKARISQELVFAEVRHHRSGGVGLARRHGSSTWEFAYCPMPHPRPTFRTLTAAVTYCIVEGWTE